MKTVYDNGGECLGDEWVDLSGLQDDTKKAILQMIHLDQTVDALNDRDNHQQNKITAMQQCLAMVNSDAVSHFNYGYDT